MSARVLYDFDGQPENGELIIRTDDIINVTRKDVGDGWWEGTINGGPLGLFPATYVEEIDEHFPPPPPAAPPSINLPPADDQYSISSYSSHDRFNDVDGTLHPEEWDDDVISIGSDTISEDQDFGSRTASMSRAGTVRKSMNRFSNFVKSGAEDFLLGSKGEQTIPQSDMLITVEGPDGVRWQPNPVPYICKITEPEKKSKYKGMKSYISYNIQPTHTNIVVGHRFKHFDWLYERLTNKYPCLSVPPLPDKQLTGRYSEDLVKKRKYLLEKWINRITRHPVLAQSAVLQHFVTVCSETRDKAWKEGKRKAETDKVVGPQFFSTIDSPQTNMSVYKVESEVDTFRDFVKNMDESSKKFIEIGENNWDKVSRSYKNEYKRLATGFEGLVGTFTTDNSPSSLALTNAMTDTGRVYHEIGDMCQDQPKKDISKILEVLREYSGILSTYPDIVTLHKGALSKVKECQKLQEDEKLKYSEVADIHRRMDVFSGAIFAEINHFHTERVKDFKGVMQGYIREQIQFHQEIINKLNSSLAMYDQVPD